MYSAGLLALLITFALNQMQTKYLLVETEDNSEADPMPKEEVKAVLDIDTEITSTDQIMLLFSLQACFMCRFYNHQENIANWSMVYIFIYTIVLAVFVLV